MTYSVDFRGQVLKVKEEERLTYNQAAERFKVSVPSIVRWTVRLEPKRNRQKPATKIDGEALKRDVEQYPDAYQYERAERLNVSQRGIGYALRRLNISYKKTPRTS